MVDDVHRQSRGANGESLERVFKGLAEQLRRLEACEDAIHGLGGQVVDNAARLDQDDAWKRRHEQEAKDAIRALLLLRGEDGEAEQGGQAATASGEFAPVRRKRHLSLVLGGLVAALAAVAGPAMAASAAGAGAVHAHHATAARDHRRARPDADPSATMRA